MPARSNWYLWTVNDHYLPRRHLGLVCIANRPGKPDLNPLFLVKPVKTYGTKGFILEDKNFGPFRYCNRMPVHKLIRMRFDPYPAALRRTHSRLDLGDEAYKLWFGIIAGGITRHRQA